MSVNPSGADTGIFQDKQVNAMDADALAPCIAWTSATMVLTMHDKWIVIFHEEENTYCKPLIWDAQNPKTIS